jgi:hypothetical protein
MLELVHYLAEGLVGSTCNARLVDAVNTVSNSALVDLLEKVIAVVQRVVLKDVL